MGAELKEDQSGERIVKKSSDKWMQNAFHKEGALHRMLGIPESELIPFTLLEKVRVTRIGTTITNPTQVGDKRIKVTKLLKLRAVGALNAKRIGQKRQKG
jgi:hypothetical protein